MLPGDAAYEDARRPAVARFDGFHPQAVVRCRSAEDVAATIAVARRTGLELAVRSGGHCFAGYSSSDGIVLDVAPLAGVTLDGGIATIGAGTRLGAVYDALAPHGVTMPAGCGPDVGIAGLTLGGGLGVLGRQHGMTSDSLVGARVVLADGRIVDCDAEREPDLFWALRGAGAEGFGVVTSLAFRTCPAPRLDDLPRRVARARRGRRDRRLAGLVARRPRRARREPRGDGGARRRAAGAGVRLRRAGRQRGRPRAAAGLPRRARRHAIRNGRAERRRRTGRPRRG